MLPPIVEKLYTKRDPAATSRNWWSEAKPAESLVALVRQLEEAQTDRRWNLLRHGFLYQNHAGLELMFSGISKAAALKLPEKYSVTYNVIKSAIDTLTSRAAANKPRPRILTEKGSWEQQQRAKRLTQYLDGTLAAAQTYRQGLQAFRDAGVFGTGVIKIYADGQKVCTERVLVSELLVDELDGAYGNPSSLYQIRYIPRATLLEEFPEHQVALLAAAPAELPATKRINVGDMIRVFEGWHLGSAGRHCMVIEGATLFDEEWCHPVFPFAFFKFCPSLASFWGQGIAEELMGTQLEINKLLRDIQRAQHLVAVPRIFIERSSEVNASHLTTEYGTIVKYTGQPPIVSNPTAISNEIYSHVRWLIQSAYEKVGISQLSATGKKPSGLDSGKALREYKDSESERFAELSAAYESFFEDIADRVLRCSADLYGQQPDLCVSAENRRFIESIKWSDACLENDKYVVRMFTSSMFPTTPAAKLQKVEEYVRAGWMDKESAIRLFDFPDVEAWETLETADRNYLDQSIESMIVKGEFVPPEPEMLLVKAIPHVRKAYLEGLSTGVDQENLALLLRWIDIATSMMPVASPAGVESAPPQGAPMGLPTSGMLPLVPGV